MTHGLGRRACFAYEGVAGLGVAAEYECGIYERIYGWLDALGLEYQATPTGPMVRPP